MYSCISRRLGLFLRNYSAQLYGNNGNGPINRAVSIGSHISPMMIRFSFELLPITSEELIQLPSCHGMPALLQQSPGWPRIKNGIAFHTKRGTNGNFQHMKMGSAMKIEGGHSFNQGSTHRLFSSSDGNRFRYNHPILPWMSHVGRGWKPKSKTNAFKYFVRSCYRLVAIDSFTVIMNSRNRFY